MVLCAWLVCALPLRSVYLAMLCVEKGAALSCSPFLYEIIHPTGGTQLDGTQVAVICSKCVILALVALFTGRADSSHAAICTLRSFSLCPP